MSINAKMTAIADAIRSKTGTTNELSLDQMAAEINGIQTDVGNTGSGNGTASNVYLGEVTLDKEATSIKVSHNLGTTDLLLCSCVGNNADDFTGSWISNTAGVNYYKIGEKTCETFVHWTGDTFESTVDSSVRSSITDDNTFTFGCYNYTYNSAASEKFAAGTYTIIIVANPV